MKYYKISAKAFTLAEILITLTIVGIVASLVIPALMNNVQENQLRVAFKKRFSVLKRL